MSSTGVFICGETMAGHSPANLVLDLNANLQTALCKNCGSILQSSFNTYLDRWTRYYSVPYLIEEEEL
jgi:hypothetical protein